MSTVTLTRKSGQVLKIPLDDILKITFQEEEKSVLDIPANARVITDNDFGKDSPEVFFTLKLAHENKLNLAGSIHTFNPDSAWTPGRIAPQWEYVYQAAQGMNVPPLTKGSQRKMIPPAGGKIEDTLRFNSAGADLIIKEALAAEHLVIFVGGQCTTVADAYLKNPSIADKITVFHTNGLYYPYASKAQGYNTQDHWSAYICAKRMRYVNCNFKSVPAYWYDGKDLGLTKAMVDSLPINPMTTLFKKWFAENYEREKMADATPVLWFLNRSLWTSTEQRKLDNETTFTFVNGHNWPQYGPTLIKQFK
jgi:hypothetical protein